MFARKAQAGSRKPLLVLLYLRRDDTEANAMTTPSPDTMRLAEGLAAVLHPACIRDGHTRCERCGPYQVLAIARALGEKDEEDEEVERLKHYPTPEAYEAATKALWKHRERAEAAEAKVEEWQDASGLERGGDPGGVRPEDLRNALAQAEQRGHDAGEAETRAIFQGEYQRGRNEEKAACVKRGHLTSADLAKMQAQARAEGIEAAAKVAEAACSCMCDVAYTSRGLVAPDCFKHQACDEAAAQIRALLPAKAPAE